MAKRNSNAKKPGRKRVIPASDWSTLEALGRNDPDAVSSLDDPIIKKIWTRRLRWYETLLLLANRLNIEYPGLKDVIVANLIPRFIRPRLLVRAKFVAYVVRQYRKVAEFVYESTRDTYPTQAHFAADSDARWQLADFVKLAKEQKAKKKARIAHFASLVMLGFESWTDDLGAYGISLLLDSLQEEALQIAHAREQPDRPRGKTLPTVIWR